MLINKNWLGRVYREAAADDGAADSGVGDDNQGADDGGQGVADLLGDNQNDDSSNQNDERPEWLQDKYLTDGKSIADATNEQAKAYTELSSKFGSFTGAPEAYEVSISEELKEAGVDIAADDPMVEQAMEFAKASNMSQEGFNGMLELYSMQMVAEAKADQEHVAEQMKALGNNADARVNNIGLWADKNLDPELSGGLKNMATTAEGVKALEKLITMTGNKQVDIDNSQANSGSTAEEVTAMQFEKDDNGNRRINTDKEFNARYEKLRDQVYGLGENRQIVG